MTTWVLLRGLTREAGHWSGFDRRLALRLSAGHGVLALDLPGNGRLFRAASPWNVHSMARACRAELAERGVVPPVVLVAMSLGAMVALEWCHLAAQEIAGCVVINTSLRGTSAPWQRLQPRNYPSLLRLLRPGLPVALRERLVMGMTSSDPQRHSDALAGWMEIGRQRPVSGANAFRQLLAAARYAPPAAAPAVPLLVLASAADRLVSPHCSERLAARWNLPLKVHSWAGHDLTLDDPDWVVQQIVEWWSSR